MAFQITIQSISSLSVVVSLQCTSEQTDGRTDGRTGLWQKLKLKQGNYQIFIFATASEIRENVTCKNCFPLQSWLCGAFLFAIIWCMTYLDSIFSVLSRTQRLTRTCKTLQQATFSEDSPNKCLPHGKGDLQKLGCILKLAFQDYNTVGVLCTSLCFKRRSPTLHRSMHSMKATYIWVGTVGVVSAIITIDFAVCRTLHAQHHLTARRVTTCTEQ